VVTRLHSIDPHSLPRPFALIVDDDPLVLGVTERVLRAIGFATMTNENPEEAFAIAQALMPDLLLTDALMPKLDGRELCRRLKSDDETRGIKIIVMSALYHGVAYRNEAFKQFHVDEYLEKPIKPGILREAVDRLMPELARAQAHSNDVRLAS
jgi:CheY-like chemotaxis protein